MHCALCHGKWVFGEQRCHGLGMKCVPRLSTESQAVTGSQWLLGHVTLWTEVSHCPLLLPFLSAACRRWAALLSSFATTIFSLSTGPNHWKHHGLKPLNPRDKINLSSFSVNYLRYALQWCNSNWYIFPLGKLCVSNKVFQENLAQEKERG